MVSSAAIILTAWCTLTQPAFAFNLPARNQSARANTMALSSTATASSATNENTSKSYLYIPSERDEQYQGNIASYLLDLDEEGATLDFCGGMMFQLKLTDKLKSHLETVATTTSNNDGQEQPVIHPASQPLMATTPNYSKSSMADNINIFHGRELRKIPSANGGMGFVLQLSYADPDGASTEVELADGITAGKGADAIWNGRALDNQGWSKEEIATYDGWRSDRFRQWRKGPMYESEGFTTFSNEFGNEAFGLNHRFYLHMDGKSQMWLSAEDGCEGTPADGKNFMTKLGEMFSFGK